MDPTPGHSFSATAFAVSCLLLACTARPAALSLPESPTATLHAEQATIRTATPEAEIEFCDGIRAETERPDSDRRLVRVAPAVASAGALLQVTGEGFTPRSEVQFYVLRPGTEAVSPTYATAVADEHGSVATTFILPDSREAAVFIPSAQTHCLLVAARGTEHRNEVGTAYLEYRP
ncbi:MAG: hypothetical protein IT299_01075 [Dehalococcoidia bacterium]|nr:hypothetical protein [Dehalococcoidia bacterium]